MYVHIDPSQIPPGVEVRDADDFTRFHVLLAQPAHAWVDPEVLAAVAGRADDDDWRSKLTGMLRYAESKGWVDAEGRIRAHVETTAVGDGTSER
jgi:hypothetical protein